MEMKWELAKIALTAALTISGGFLLQKCSVDDQLSVKKGEVSFELLSLHCLSGRHNLGRDCLRGEPIFNIKLSEDISLEALCRFFHPRQPFVSIQP